ncbi:MAG: hypothetical protein ACLP1Y_00200 [Candidatus Acidiferrales bacterium]
MVSLEVVEINPIIDEHSSALPATSAARTTLPGERQWGRGIIRRPAAPLSNIQGEALAPRLLNRS